jgi:allantoicase
VELNVRYWDGLTGRSKAELGRQKPLAQVGTNGWHGWEADRRLRMRNAEWLTLTLIEATLVEATLVGITHRLRRFANVR